MYQYKGEVYYVRNSKRFRVYSPRVLESWGLEVLRGSVELEQLPLGTGPLGFRDGTKVKNYANGKSYVISAGKKRQIVSPDVLKRHGWRKIDFLVASDDEVNLHDDGEVLR
ncbi:MAG: hypothetical protein LC650_01005 [Actinobacteria bacterium]|nr:hypothetical protein [Actinomycetota bacterium]